MAQSDLQRIAGFCKFFEDLGFSERLITFHQDKTSILALANIVHLLQSDDEIRILYSPINNAFLESVIETSRQESVIRSTAKIVHDHGAHSAGYLRNGLIDILLD